MMKRLIFAFVLVGLLEVVAVQGKTFTEAKLGNYSVTIARFWNEWTGLEEFEVKVQFTTLDSAGTAIRNRSYNIELSALSSGAKTCLQTLRSELKTIIKTKEGIP